MTRPVPRRHAVDSVDSDLFERQDAVLSIWAEKLRGKQRLFSEREHVFEGTRLALGGPRRRRSPPPAASPALEHSPRRVGITGRASAARSPAAPLLARPPAVLLTGSSTSPLHSGYASHLGSTEAPVPDARLCTPPASSSRRKRHTRRHNMDYFQQLPEVSPSDCFPPSFDSSLKTTNKPISDSWDVSLLEDSVDWEDLFCSAPPKTVNGDGRKARATSDKSVTVPVYANPRPGHSSTVLSESAPSSTCQPVPVSSAQATVKNTQSPKPVSITLPVSISTPISQPIPTPVPAPRTRAAVTQYTSTPAPVSRVGVTGVQPPPVPVPAPRLRAARIQPDHPRGPAEALQPVPSCSGGSEELACLPISPPLHPPPDPAFHALALSLVRLAEVSPAQAPALLAQAVALSPSVIQSLAQPLATPTPAQQLASPTSVHPVASPAQSVPSPAVQPPVQSVHSPAVQLPLQSAPAQSPVAQSPPVLQSPPVAQSPPALQSPPVAQSPPALQSPPVAQSPPALQSPPVAQSPPVLQSPPVAQSPPVLQSPPVAQSPPVLQSPPAQSAQSPPVRPSVVQSSVVQSLIHHPVQFPELQPQHPEPAVSSPAPQPGASAPAGPAAVAPSPPAPMPSPGPALASASALPASALPGPASALHSPASASALASPGPAAATPSPRPCSGRRRRRGRPPDLLSGRRRLPRGRPPDLLQRHSQPRGRPPELSRLGHIAVHLNCLCFGLQVQV
ncbi:unnamed protein product [Oreochromis niloticus]|nr:unnamed protein product [Mustela putorius furo]